MHSVFVEIHISIQTRVYTELERDANLFMLYKKNCQLLCFTHLCIVSSVVFYEFAKAAVYCNTFCLNNIQFNNK